MLVAVLSEMIGAMVHAPHKPLPVTAGPELFDALGGRATVGMIVDGLYDRLERDRSSPGCFGAPGRVNALVSRSSSKDSSGARCAASEMSACSAATSIG